MTIKMKQILTYPSPILREKILMVEKVDQTISAEIEELTKILIATENTAAGLAATQIGYKRRFFGLKVGKENAVEIFINPKVTRTDGKKVYPMIVFDDGKQENFLEGCLSFPDLFGTVKRWLKVEVEWEEIKNDNLVKKKKIMEGFEAIVFQHEAEHLDGVLFIDHIKEEGGKLYRYEGKKRKLVDVKKI
ncbi:MAG: peptide deformylase [Candidatus Shapirobacteria bacterium]|nr:peptide deformylase [Candidatus Shapirobacteria bacterium]